MQKTMLDGMCCRSAILRLLFLVSTTSNIWNLDLVSALLVSYSIKSSGAHTDYGTVFSPQILFLDPSVHGDDHWLLVLGLLTLVNQDDDITALQVSHFSLFII